MTNRNSPRQLTTGPLIIRPHHLSHYIAYLRAVNEPEAMTPESIRQIFLEDRTQKVEDMLAYASGKPTLEKLNLDEALYRFDTYGDNSNTVDRNVSESINLFEEFATGPDNRPVEFKLAKDGICKRTCAIGKHCNVMENDSENRYMGFAFVLLASAGKTFDVSKEGISTTLGDIRTGIMEFYAASNVVG